MADSTVTVKGQTTVPIAVREQLGIAAGTRMAWHVMPDGTVIVRIKNKSAVGLAGSLKVAGRKRVATRDMNPWR